MKRIFIPFIVLYVLFVAAMMMVLAVFPKGELHLLLNSYHAPFGDCLFMYFTQLAEWPLYIIAALPLFFRKAGWTYLYLASELTCALIICLVKRCFDAPRPIIFFEHSGVKPPLVEGVSMCCRHSFPSGHTSTFFVFATLSALLLAYYSRQESSVRKRTCCTLLIILLFSFSVIGGYSRIYLSQHFLSDVLGGSIIGFIVPCAMFWLFYKQQWMQKRWFNKRVF
ncbi:phosphatase PAP2 family protein [Prevotella sp. HUN102]|uniref:phosphatase PAP2 family protein n=1 Tax=Prevotella sp. HUN102 TaxID=1392486 RepID=UPI000691AEB7|nr:phosphatase PAP2 family protein [Prevotella sp. HUN102]